MSRPPTGFRPPTSSLRTAAGPRPSYSRSGVPSSYGPPPGTSSQMAAGGVALAQQVRVADRPVTREGMRAATSAGARPQTGLNLTSSHGSRRVVHDQSFFLGEIRTRVTEITREIEGLRLEDEQIQRDNASFAHFQKRNEQLATDVSRLRDELADANMVIEKARLGESVVQVDAECAQQKAVNADLKRQLDALFTDRVAKEEKKAQILARIEAHDTRLEQAMQDPARRSLYWTLRQESERLLAEIASKQAEINLVHERTENLLAQMKQIAPSLAKSAQLDDERRALEARLSDLEHPESSAETSSAASAASSSGIAGDASAASGNPASEKELLLQRVKEENKKVQLLQSEIAELREAMDAYEAQSAAVGGGPSSPSPSLAKSTAAANAQKDEEMAAKLRDVQARDAEMTTFLDNFDSVMQAERKKTDQFHETIVGILEHISRTQALEHQLPTSQQHEDMKADLAFKTQQKEYAENTVEKLNHELDTRRKELEKMRSLDEKIDKEVASLKERMSVMNADLKRFQDSAKVAKEMEADAKDLTSRRDGLVRMRDSLRNRVSALSADVENRRRALANNAQHVALEALEGRIRFSAQNVHALQEFVAAKGEEINFVPKRQRVLQVAADVNSRIIAAQTQGISSY
eukprot:ANDGO_06169.mRNA.1 Intraflagellar transport protein 74